MIRWFKILILIIIASLQAVNNTADANNLIVADNRFTSAAYASDNAQCASLWGIYIGVRMTTRIACTSACVAAAVWAGGSGSVVCPPTCFTTAEAAGWLALWGAYEGYQAWAGDIRKNTKVVNTIDIGKERCTATSGDLKENFGGSDTRWRQTGPLANYCYAEEFNHHLKHNSSNPSIYNGGEGKIGISYKGNTPEWIEPQNCKAIATSGFMSFFGPTRQFCAWTEGDEICAEAVFCTGLIFGDVVPIYGFVGDPTRLAGEARRDCGDNPYTDEEGQGASHDLVNDFGDNGRCECFCCTGSDSNTPNEAYDICDEFMDRNNRSCKTYNERYYAHCVKTPVVEEDFSPPSAPPRTVSYHCRMDVLSGYTDFSFVGKAVRCFTKTIENMYFGWEDIPILDSNGEQLFDLNGSARFTTQCIDGMGTMDNCTNSLYRTTQNGVAGILTLTLTLWMVFLGFKFVLVGTMSKGDFMKYLLKLSVVVYFVSGNGWRDGYFNFLMYGGYELSADYLEATVQSADTDTLAAITTTVDFDSLNNPDIDRCSFTDLGVVSGDAWAQMQTCNFFDGIAPDGTTYSNNERYYAVLDSLDCRFAKYTGFDRNNYFPEIIKVATAILFDSPAGFVFFIAAMAFLICSLLLLLKVSFMLIGIAIMISFLIYVSPIIIPLMLFERTKKIFDKWLGLLLGYSLQPFLILALIALIILLIDGFFLSYLEPIYGVAGVEYKEVGLGVTAPSLSTDYNSDMLVSNMVKFLFLLVVIMHVFDKFGSILNAVSGAAEVGSFIKPPDFGGAMKKGVKKAAGAAKSVGKYGAIKARQKVGEGVKKMTGQGKDSGDSSGGGASGGGTPGGGAGSSGGGASGG